MAFAVLTVEVAGKRGVGRVSGFFFGLLFGPVGLLCTLLWPGGLAYDFRISAQGNLVCQTCCSIVPSDALKCRFCHTQFHALNLTGGQQIGSTSPQSSSEAGMASW